MAAQDNSHTMSEPRTGLVLRRVLDEEDHGGGELPPDRKALWSIRVI